MEFKQTGRNEKYPEKVVTWSINDNIIPPWLSDVSKVVAIDNNTRQPILERRNTSSGGYEIISAEGSTKLVSTKTKNDIICKSIDSSEIFSMTQKEFEFIYGKYSY